MKYVNIFIRGSEWEGDEVLDWPGLHLTSPKFRSVGISDVQVDFFEARGTCNALVRFVEILVYVLCAALVIELNYNYWNFPLNVYPSQTYWKRFNSFIRIWLECYRMPL
jgi:hypothetical protein